MRPRRTLGESILDELRDLGGGTRRHLPIAELRRRLSSVSRDRFYRALLELEEAGFLTLLPCGGLEEDEGRRRSHRGVLTLVGLKRQG